MILREWAADTEASEYVDAVILNGYAHYFWNTEPCPSSERLVMATKTDVKEYFPIYTLIGVVIIKNEFKKQAHYLSNL